MQDATRENATIERQLEIEATPATVYEVITSPTHLQEWWPDEAVLDPTPGGTGELVFGTRGSPDAQTPQVTVVEAEPPGLFSFWWTHPEGVEPREGTALLVTFALTPTDGGTHLRMTETGFRERGWDAAELAHELEAHGAGWDHFLPRLAAYASTVAMAS